MNVFLTENAKDDATEADLGVDTGNSTFLTRTKSPYQVQHTHSRNSRINNAHRARRPSQCHSKNDRPHPAPTSPPHA